MKAISIHQPWADLITNGKRPLEVRKWKTHYRGPLIIHASLTVEKEECSRLVVTPSATGALIGVVELQSVLILSEKDWEDLRPLHLETGPRPYGNKTFGWVLRRPRKFVKPIPFRGSLCFFTIPDSILAEALK
ncbi:MAG: ASCH domain-containing protein [bacterium]|nr:ASCH domain-containing protein [bacterium]